MRRGSPFWQRKRGNKMSAQILSGKELSAEIRTQLKQRVAELKQEKGITPGLAVIQVGDDGGSTIYVNNKEKACAEVGIYSEVKPFARRDDPGRAACLG